jgi:membrane protease YdiL (CAAX protease family)
MYIVGSIVVEIVAAPIDGDNPGVWVDFISYLCLTAGTFFMLQVWLIGVRKATWRTIGFRLPPASSIWKSIGIVVLIALVAYLATTIGTAIIVAIFNATPFHIRSNVKELLPKHHSTVTVVEFVVLLILTGIVAPITEECLFRGALYQGILKSTGWARAGGAVTIAALTSGLLFGCFHLLGGAQLIYTLPLLAYLGIVLALTFQFSRSLGGSMLLHSSINSLSVVFFYGPRIH